MTYDQYRSVFLICAIAGAVLLAVSVILFFALKIPKAIAFLTGRTRRTAIEQFHQRWSGEDAKEEQRHEQVTDDIIRTGNPRKPLGGSKFHMPEVRGGNQDAEGETTAMRMVDETAPLVGSKIVNGIQWEEKPESVDATTGSLTPRAVASDSGGIDPNIPFAVECEITFIHTSEVIDGGTCR